MSISIPATIAWPSKRPNAENGCWPFGLARDGVANLQVANEFVYVTRRKMPRLPVDDVFATADEIIAWGNSPITYIEILGARRLHLALGYSWWDCLLLASALELGCTHFLSVDLQDGQRIQAGGEALTIVSPFAHTPDEILSRQG